MLSVFAYLSLTTHIRQPVSFRDCCFEILLVAARHHRFRTRRGGGVPLDDTTPGRSLTRIHILEFNGARRMEAQVDRRPTSPPGGESRNERRGQRRYWWRSRAMGSAEGCRRRQDDLPDR